MDIRHDLSLCLLPHWYDTPFKAHLCSTDSDMSLYGDPQCGQTSTDLMLYRNPLGGVYQSQGRAEPGMPQ